MKSWTVFFPGVWPSPWERCEQGQGGGTAFQQPHSSQYPRVAMEGTEYEQRGDGTRYAAHGGGQSSTKHSVTEVHTYDRPNCAELGLAQTAY